LAAGRPGAVAPSSAVRDVLFHVVLFHVPFHLCGTTEARLGPGVPEQGSELQFLSHFAPVLLLTNDNRSATLVED
jgi:hypothetical protein